jgi:bacterial/archaeal transporter family protein
MGWLFYAIVSAVASALTAILAKVGVEQVPSTLAVAYRTAVVLVLATLVAASSGQLRGLTMLSRKSLVFLTLSGLMTGVAWLAYFRALQLGPASRVAPIDKLSLPMTIVLAALALGEPMSWRLAAGAALMTIGAVLTIR